MSENDIPLPEKPVALSGESHLVVFGGKRIRRKWMDEQWFFSIINIVRRINRQRQPVEILGFDEAAREGGDQS